jgi:hypothetical protein
MYNAVPSFKAGEGTSEIALDRATRLVNHHQVPRLY